MQILGSVPCPPPQKKETCEIRLWKELKILFDQDFCIYYDTEV